MSWDYFPDETWQPGARLKVVALTHSTQHKSSTRYFVRFDCCGAEREITHQGIERRAANRNIYCRACRPNGAAPNPEPQARPSELAIPVPAWPVPAGVTERTRRMVIWT